MCVIDIPRVIEILWREFRGRQEEHVRPRFRSVEEHRFLRGAARGHQRDTASGFFPGEPHAFGFAQNARAGLNTTLPEEEELEQLPRPLGSNSYTSLTPFTSCGTSASTALKNRRPLSER